jgi:hypothetical protein
VGVGDDDLGGLPSSPRPAGVQLSPETCPEGEETAPRITSSGTGVEGAASNGKLARCLSRRGDPSCALEIQPRICIKVV